MDIRSKRVEQTAVLHLKDANDEPMFDGVDAAGEPVPVNVTLFSPGSKEYAAAETENSNRMVDRLKKKGKTETTPEQNAREQAEFLTKVTKEFSANFSYVTDDGTALKGGAPNPKLAMAVYRDKEIGFIAEQINKHVRDWGNFSKGSTNSSAATSASSPG